MTTPSMDEIEVPDRPDVPGLHFRRFRGAADFPGMAAANQAAREQAGSLEVVSAEDMARSYAHLENCDPERDILDRRARRRDRRLRPGRVARPGRRVARLHRDLPAPPRGSPARASGRRCWAGPRAGWPPMPPACRPTDHRRCGPGPGTPTKAPRSCCERHGWTPEPVVATRWSARPSTTSRRCRCRTGSRSAPSSARPRSGVSGTPPPRPSATSAARSEWSEEDWARNQDDPHRDPTLWAIAFDGRRGRGRRPGTDRSRRERPPRRPPGLHRGRLDAPAVAPPRPGAGAPRPGPRRCSASAG